VGRGKPLAIKKVDNWIRQQLIDDVISIRSRQTAALENVAFDALNSWKESIGQVETITVKDSDGKGRETTVKTERRHGDPQYLMAAMKALGDIREMWGVNKPAQMQVDIGTGGLERVCGKSRVEALTQQAAALLAAAGGVTESSPESLATSTPDIDETSE